MKTELLQRINGLVQKAETDSGKERIKTLVKNAEKLDGKDGLATDELDTLEKLFKAVNIEKPTYSDKEIQRVETLLKRVIGITGSKKALPNNVNYFTPVNALKAALSEPLVFVDRANGEDIGLHSYLCLWRNSKVLVRTNYCSKEHANRAVGVEIYSPKGEKVRLYAEVVVGSKTVYQAKKEDYTMFKAEYADLSSFTTNLVRKPSIRRFKTFDKLRDRRVMSGNYYPGCFEAYVNLQQRFGNTTRHWSRDLGFITCDIKDVEKDHALEKAGTEFLKNPPKEWFDFVRTIETLYNKHKFK